MSSNDRSITSAAVQECPHFKYANTTFRIEIFVNAILRNRAKIHVTPVTAQLN